MIKVFNLFFFVKRALVLASLLFFVQPLSASNESINQVEMAECIEGFCVKLNTEKMFKSALGNIYAFGSSNIEIQSNMNLPRKKFKGFEGTFNPRSRRFSINKKGDSKEYVIDVKAREVYSFPGN